jgi:hypothetical protein
MLLLPNMVHGSVITQLSTIQSLLAPPQNNPHIYLVYEVNTPQNNYVHPLSPELHIHPLNTQILTTIPQIHLNLSLKFNPILKIHIIPFPFPFFTIWQSTRTIFKMVKSYFKVNLRQQSLYI